MLNVHSIVGNLSKEPELKTSNNGKSYCNFSVAVNHWQKDATGNTKTSFFNCVCFGVTAEYLGANGHKGMRVAVSGEGMQDKYADKETGKEKTTYKISATTVDIIEKRDTTAPIQATRTTNMDDQQSMNVDASSIEDPFQDC